jgi:hypothetical protein
VLARLDVEDVYRVVKPASVQQKDDVLGQIDAIAKRANGDVAQKLDTRADAASTARVHEVARLLGEDSDCLLAWLVGSGFVHGRPYASDMLLSSVEVGVKAHHNPAGDGQRRRHPLGNVVCRHHAQSRPAALPHAWSCSTRCQLKGAPVELIIRDGRALETGGLRAGSRSGSQSVESRWGNGEYWRTY